MISSSITFRKALRADQDWLFALKCDTMRDYVGAVFGWDDDVQLRIFLERFDPTRLSIIQVNGPDVGLLELEERADRFFIAQIEVQPANQKRGIGTAVLSSILREAAAQQKPVGLQVLKPNPARRLYERLGFKVCGETVTHYEMEVGRNGLMR